MTRLDPLHVETPWKRPPLTENQRLHWAPKSKLVREVRGWAGVLFRSTRFADWPIAVEMTWYVNDKRKRDEENTIPTLKALCDGLVDAGVVPDDTPEYMRKEMPRIVLDRNTPPRIVLTIKNGPRT
jgi:hypothetical protein